MTKKRLTEWQAIIFDFDGVIAESTEIKTQAFAALYRPFGEAIVAEVVAYHLRHGGLSRYHKFHYFQEHLLAKPPLSPEQEKQLDQQFSALVVEAVIAADSVPGATEFIRSQAKKIPLFVASGTPEIELKTIVERRGLSPYFTQVCGAPVSKKTLLAQILSTHGLKPGSVLMIGDAQIDFESAQANGTAFLGRVRPGESNPFPPHIEVVPDLCGLT